MVQQPNDDDAPSKLCALRQAPSELTSGRLHRLGEGIEKVVYASEHWVVKRQRSPSEVIALIVLWRMLRSLDRIVPGAFFRRLLQRPSRRLRFLRVLVQTLVLVFPQSFWFSTRIGEIWRSHRMLEVRGRHLALSQLTGTFLVPATVVFPPTRLRVAGWPFWLTMSEATVRVEATLQQRLETLAEAGRFQEVESWLNRFLDFRCAGWQRGVFSVDSHLKNFGVSGDQVVLLDPGGLTDTWTEIDERLDSESVEAPPHARLGLESLLSSHSDIAARFDARWKATVNHAEVRRQWLVHGS